MTRKLRQREPAELHNQTLGIDCSCNSVEAPVCTAHTSTDQLYTFGLMYGTEYGDEIDAYGSDRQTAHRHALDIADAMYPPKYDLVDLPAGGSAGVIYGSW